MKRRYTWTVFLLAVLGLALLVPAQAPAARAQSGERAAITADTLDDLTELAVIPHHHREVWSVAVDPSGTLLATGDYDGLVRLWDVTDPGAILDPVVTWDAHDLHVYALDFAPVAREGVRSETLASAGWDGAIRVWNVRAPGDVGEQFELWQGEPVYALDFHPTGDWLASGGGYSRNQVRIWDVAHRALHAIPGDHYDWVNAVSYSPDGRYLASGSGDGAWHLWDARLDDPGTVVHGHSGAVGGVAFSPDSSVLATSSLDGTIKLWSPASHDLLQTIDAGGYVWQIAFSPDGSLLAAGARDGQMKFWDVAAGELLRTIQAHPRWVTSFAFSPDGSLLVTGGENGAVKLWGVE